MTYFTKGAIFIFGKGSFNNHVDKIFITFDPLPPQVDNFTYWGLWSNMGIWLTPSPLFLSTWLLNHTKLYVRTYIILLGIIDVLWKEVKWSQRVFDTVTRRKRSGSDGPWPKFHTLLCPSCLRYEIVSVTHGIEVVLSAHCLKIRFLVVTLL